ncbi:hypothetical protein [Haloarchaeobius sp. DT45]|uniref:hypothetical protein n=1 Tax=Haloarchaeobius sp. DT45 TaxID=3446116 RepID=UPI003F6D79EB
MPTRESEASTGSTGDLSDVVDAFDVETVDAVIEDNDTGESEVDDPDAVFDSLLEIDDQPTERTDHPGRGPPLSELDGAFAAVETELERDGTSDGLGRWIAYDGFDFAGRPDTPASDTGPSAHEEFKSLAAESEAIDLDDLDLDELTLGDGTVAASLDVDMPTEEHSLAEAMVAGDGEPGAELDEDGFDWD